jgi:endonuclease YncB( thermonuclease family)
MLNEKPCNIYHITISSKYQGCVSIISPCIDIRTIFNEESCYICMAKPYGKASGKYLASLIAGATVEVETVTTDRYGRTVGIVWDSETNINQEMVQAGYAWVYQRYCDKPFCEYWFALEKKAKANRLGLWQESNPIPPWEWRKKK